MKPTLLTKETSLSAEETCALIKNGIHNKDYNLVRNACCKSYKKRK